MQQQTSHTPYEYGATSFEWVELILNWSLEIGIAVIVPISIAYYVNRKKK